MDDDIIRYTIVPFNLEVMKISSYYKSKNELVLFAPEFVPDRHQKFFFRKDYNDGIYPIGLGEHENVEYGGLAFSNNKYVPLPIEIERVRPDPLIYEKMRNRFLSSSFPDRKKLFDNMIEGEHCRLSLDGKTIWNEFERQFRYLGGARNLILHDYDLGAIEGSLDCVKYLMKHARQDGWGTRLGMKFPIRLSKGKDLIEWSKFKTNSTLFALRFDGVIEDEEFLEWVALCKEHAVFRQMEYYITSPRYDENRFINEVLPKIFKQVIISRTFRVFISLKYDEEFLPKPTSQWAQLIKLLNCFEMYGSHRPTSAYLKSIRNVTMFDFVSNAYDIPLSHYGELGMTKQEMREVFYLIKEKNYSLFKSFYEDSYNSLGGKL